MWYNKSTNFENMPLFSRRPRRQIGIDIGTSSIKVVELSREGSHVALQNYGLLEGLDFFGDIDPAHSSSFKKSEQEIIAAVRQLLQVTRIQTREVVFSIPIFSSFLTVIELPYMNLKDLERAVPFQARSYIPVPMSEVVLDWLAIPPREAAPPSSPRAPSTISVLLVAAPKEVISKYQRVVQGLGLQLRGLESESFSLVRSLVGKDLTPTMLVDFGAGSTNLTIVDRGFVRLSHTVDLSGKEITKAVARGLSISPSRAEELKRTTGLAGGGEGSGLAGLITPLVDRIIGDYEKMVSTYLRKEKVKIERIILSGGAANLPALATYLSRRLATETIIGDPFARLSYPPELKPIFKKDLALPLAVAVGLALRDF